MTLKDLCEEIGMPAEVTEEVLGADTGIDHVRAERIMSRLCRADAFTAAYEEAKSILTEKRDPRGIKMLRLTLSAALGTKKKYDGTGIDSRVFFDTMGCFSRFVREYKQAYGAYGFDRGWWVGRQLSLTLMRLGELEYELTEFGGERAISVHIPSDADISSESTEKSFETARQFMRGYFSEYCDAVWFCESWLLSPVLRKFLLPHSNILRFAEKFDIIKTDEDAEDYIRWVYNIPDLAPECFCENTSLQRNIKKHVLAGGKIGTATGILKRGSL